VSGVAVALNQGKSGAIAPDKRISRRSGDGLDAGSDG